MARYDLSDFLGDGSTVLEGIRSPKHPDGKEYTFPSPSAKDGLHLTELFMLIGKTKAGIATAEDLAALKLDDDQERDIYRMVMGSTYNELLADGVLWTSMKQIFGVLFRAHAAGEDIDTILTSSGEAPARPNRATRRAGQKSAKGSGGTANAIRRRASTESSASPTPPEEAKAV